MTNANESLKATEAESASVQQPGTQRVTLEYMQSRIERTHYRTAEALPHMTICEMLFDNGFVVIGKSAPADPANYNAPYGERLAYEDCIRQAWPLFGFLLCENRFRLASADASSAFPAGE